MSPRRIPSAGRLLDLWQRRQGDGEPIGCAATTFTFDAAFFEEQCLARFVGIDSDPNEAEDERAYLIEREEKLSQVTACVLVDQHHVSTYRSLRWDVLPVRHPDRGILHAKLTILAWQNRVRVLIGSANLTEPGYRRNYEQVSPLDFTPEGSVPLSLLREVLAFARRLLPLTPGSVDEEGPKAKLASFLACVDELTEDWEDPTWKRGEPRAALCPVWPGEPSLLDQLGELWSGPKPDMAHVVSPFYDQGDRAGALIERLSTLLVSRGERAIRVYGPGRTLPDGCIELEMPAILGELEDLHFAYVPDRDDDENLRSLHAKTLWFVRDGRELGTIGSSNFTAAGTGTGTVQNIELNLAYLIPDGTSPLGKACDAAFPDFERVEPDAKRRFVDPQERTADGDAAALLPAAFGAALYDACEPEPIVVLEFVGDPPAGFSVTGPGGEAVTTEAAWRAAGARPKLPCAWPGTKPPSHLEVSWDDLAGEPPALWVVNVRDASALPPPDELRSLSLEELIAVLTSARPLHEAIAAVERRRALARTKHDVETDPHKKVDASGFLLRRVRRVSHALEGLRERLERPVFHLDSLRWRLEGPLGPVALAKRLAAEEGEGAAFLMVEVAQIVATARIGAAGGRIDASDLRRLRASVIASLEALAAEHPAPANLERYVGARFAEIERS